MRKINEVLYDSLPLILMVFGQFVYVGMNILYKLAAKDQFSPSILIAYRFMFSSALIVPLALYVERNKRPKMTWMVLFQSFLCAAFGATISQNMFAKSLGLTSATYATAISNLSPAITFVLALIMGIEKLQWRKGGGKLKVFGTILGIGGAMVLTFYKGITINIWKSSINLLTLVGCHSHENSQIVQPKTSDEILGSCLALGSVIFSAIWLNIQAKMMKNYPCPYSVTALMLVMGSFQGTIYALCTERDWSQWRLGWNIRLLAVAYSGILASGAMYTIAAWCIQIKGPLFVAIFNPLMLIIMAIVASLLLGEQLYLGSVLGAIFIICGVYMVIWGKKKDIKRATQLVPEPEEGISLPVMETEKEREMKRDSDSNSNSNSSNIREKERERKRDSNSNSNSSNSKCIEIDIISSADISTLTVGRISHHASSNVDEDIRRSHS